MLRRLLPCVAAFWLALGCALPAQATILTFEIFDPNLDFLPYNDPLVPPTLAGFGYPEGFRIDSYFNTAASGGYGSRVTATSVDADGGVKFLYGNGAEGFTPNVRAFYGPFSIFTGGPTLFRGGFSDLNGVLYQGSGENLSPIGFDYDILDIVLVADAGFDVVLHDFDLGSFLGDRTINSITVFDGFPFPFLTPSNFLSGPNGPIAIGGTAHHQSFGAGLQAPAIWLRIDANNLGTDSINIGIDNIRFGQVASANEGTLDPDDINAAFVSAEAPEPGSIVLWLVGAMFAATVPARRRQVAASV